MSQPPIIRPTQATRTASLGASLLTTVIVCGLWPAPAMGQGTFARTGRLSEPRYGHTATLLPDGRVLVVGGGDPPALSLSSSAEIYDPGSGWANAGSMAEGRVFHTATPLPDGRVLVVGGGDGSGGYRSSAEIYDLASGAWANTQSMATPRSQHTATLLQDGRVLVTGGYGTSSTESLRSFRVFEFLRL